MKLETFRMKGVLRFKDEVSLDYRELPPGLIAFVGPYGEGKSTTLEGPLAGLYREFPSRSDKEILDYVHGTDAFIESTFELEGRGLFRARLSLDGPHRKSEAILARILPDGSQVMLNDGKLTSFDAAVAEYLPPKDLILASVFAAQNRHGSFSTLDRKGRRQLFASLLGLEHLQAMAERAKSAAGLVQHAIDRLTAVRDVLARETGETLEQDLEQRAQQLQADGGQVESRRVELQRDLAAIEQELATLQDAASTYATARGQADRLHVEVVTAQAQFTTCGVSLDRHASDLSAQRAAIGTATTQAVFALSKQLEDTSEHRGELATIAAALTTALRDIDERIANNTTLLAEKDTIEAAIAQIATIDRAIGVIRLAQPAAAERVTAVRLAERVLRESLAAIEMAERDLARAWADAGLLGTVPCGGGGEFAACQFLRNATEAHGRIPALTEVVDAKPATLAQLHSAEAALAALAADATGYQQQIARLDAERTPHEAHATRRAHVDTAAQRIADLEQARRNAQADATRHHDAAVTRETRRITDLRERYRLRDEECVRQLEDLERLMAVRYDDLTATAARLTESLQVLASEREALEAILTRHAGASAQAAAQRALVTLRRTEWDDSTAWLARVTSQREELDRRVAALGKARAELDAHDARLYTLHADLIEWHVLSKALGRDGLQTIEIDEAGPAVSTYANTFLESSYGTRFTLDLITQEARRAKSADGSTMKEVFELRVIDARDGIVKDIVDLSGGEKIIVEEALKSAIAVFVNLRNPHPIRTCWRDETTSGLNPEAVGPYMQMLRRVCQVGGFHHLILVSHNQDACLMADAQVVFGGGRLEVVLPPYGARMEAAA